MNSSAFTKAEKTWGTPLNPEARQLMLLGSGELGKEVAIEAMRLGVEVIAVDTYNHAPAMQVAHRAYVIDLLDGEQLQQLVEQEQPDLIVPEIEAIATDALLVLEQQGWQVIPTARATRLTMDREGIRRLAAEELGLKTSPYRFVTTKAEFQQAIAELGLPCVVKPVMSSSGKGQSIIHNELEVETAWEYAQSGGRVQGQKMIVEGFIDFDFEITLLTLRSIEGTSFCPPIGHIQVNGDYRESWQPCPLNSQTWHQCQLVAEKITTALGGRGIFGVELFIKEGTAGENIVYFSEVSPRPHDTGMVTMISQNMSEFELHVRAILGLPIGKIQLVQPGASAVILAQQTGIRPQFVGIDAALEVPTSKLRIFGKPTCRKNRRMGVALALGDTVEQARERATTCAAQVNVVVQSDLV